MVCMLWSGTWRGTQKKRSLWHWPCFKGPFIHSFILPSCRHFAFPHSPPHVGACLHTSALQTKSWSMARQNPDYRDSALVDNEPNLAPPHGEPKNNWHAVMAMPHASLGRGTHGWPDAPHAVCSLTVGHRQVEVTACQKSCSGAGAALQPGQLVVVDALVAVAPARRAPARHVAAQLLDGAHRQRMAQVVYDAPQVVHPDEAAPCGGAAAAAQRCRTCAGRRPRSACGRRARPLGAHRCGQST